MELLSKRDEHAKFGTLYSCLLAPVHGGWSMWSEWNHCSMDKSCGIGYQRRFRVCDNPKPMYGGVTCPGFPVEARMCYPYICIGK